MNDRLTIKELYEIAKEKGMEDAEIIFSWKERDEHNEDFYNDRYPKKENVRLWKQTNEVVILFND